jgi:vacuolar-type H+-ATPase subunit I/STV1
VSCKDAITNSIIVNTIFCGACEQGVSLMWKDGADRADGKYMCINQNESVVHIETPYDEEIVKLNESLNKTYIAFGSEGKAKQQRQIAQDRNARSSGGAANIAERAKTKSQKKMYNNATWDMVDAVEEDEAMIEEVEEEALPEEMQEMDMEERKAYVTEKSEERTKIQKEIQEISEKRTKYIAEKRKEAAVDTDNTLDGVMLKTVREQAQSNGFKFEKE